MKVRFNKTTWRAVGGICASFLMLVSFQNCGKAGFDAELDSNLDVSSEAALNAKYGSITGAKVQDIPFSIETTFDTITYNSCADTHVVNKPGFFTLRAGAYSTGGIRIKQEFYDYADSNFKPVYPETALTETQYKEFLVDAPENNGAVAMMAIRPKNSLTDVYTKDGKAATLGVDIVALVGTLTHPQVLDAFSNRGVTANYFPFSPELRILEGELSYNANEANANIYRDILSNAGVLAITYVPKTAEINKVRAPDVTYPVKNAYGKAYSMTFSQLTSVTNAVSNPSRVLASVTERDLNTPTIGAQVWNCSRNYKIIRAADAAGYCPPHSQTDLSNPTIRSELEIARRHLRSDQWEINVTNRCAVPKGSISCYKETQYAGAPIVQYDLSQACFDPTNPLSPTPNSACMHFITVCTRD